MSWVTSKKSKLAHSGSAHYVPCLDSSGRFIVTIVAVREIAKAEREDDRFPHLIVLGALPVSRQFQYLFRAS